MNIEEGGLYSGWYQGKTYVFVYTKQSSTMESDDGVVTYVVPDKEAQVQALHHSQWGFESLHEITDFDRLIYDI